MKREWELLCYLFMNFWDAADDKDIYGVMIEGEWTKVPWRWEELYEQCEEVWWGPCPTIVLF